MELISAMKKHEQGEDDRLTITEVAKRVGVTAKTIMRWEKAGKIKPPRRDWRGWRIYTSSDVDRLQKFHDTLYEL